MPVSLNVLKAQALALATAQGGSEGRAAGLATPAATSTDRKKRLAALQTFYQRPFQTPTKALGLELVRLGTKESITLAAVVHPLAVGAGARRMALYAISAATKVLTTLTHLRQWWWAGFVIVVLHLMASVFFQKSPTDADTRNVCPIHLAEATASIGKGTMVHMSVITYG